MTEQLMKHQRDAVACECGETKVNRPRSGLPPRKDGRPRTHWICLACQANKARAWRAAYPLVSRRSASETKYRRQYGMSIEEAEAFRAEHGCCDLCGGRPNKSAKRKEDRLLHIDHNHDTGHIRGALCKSCNLRLGWVETHFPAIKAYLDA